MVCCRCSSTVPAHSPSAPSTPGPLLRTSPRTIQRPALASPGASRLPALVTDRRRDNAVERVSGLDPAELGMQNCKRRIETRLRGRQSVTGSPRQGANMVTDPCENIVRKHGYQSRSETSVTAITAKKPETARKTMSALAVIFDAFHGSHRFVCGAFFDTGVGPAN